MPEQPDQANEEDRKLQNVKAINKKKLHNDMKVKYSKVVENFKFDSVTVAKGLIKILKHDLKKFTIKKKIKEEIKESLETLLLYSRDEKCSRIIGDEIANDVDVFLHYMTALTNDGKDYPIKASLQEEYACFQTLRDVLQNYTDTSAHFGIAVGKKGFIPQFLKELQQFKETFNENKKSKYVVQSAMDILYNCAWLSENVRYFKEIDAVTAVEWYAKNAKDKDDLLTTSIMLLAYIVDQANKDIISLDEWIIKMLLDLLSGAVESESGRFKGYTATELVRGIRRLATNEKNSTLLVESGLLNHLMKLMNKGVEKEQVAAVSAVWAVALYQQNIPAIKSNGRLIVKLHSFAQQKEEKELHKAAAGALWVMEKMNEDQLENKTPKNVASSQLISTNQVMISYSWNDNKEFVIEVKNRLQASGYKTWIDVDNATGEIYEKIAKAIENSAIVLSFVSRKYKNSVNCKTECLYAKKRRRKVIPILIEEGYTGDDWLGLILAGKKYFDFRGDHRFKENFPDLLKELEESMVSKVEYPKPSPSQAISVRSWTPDDFSKWLQDNNIKSIDGQRFDGEVLLFLKKVKSEAPEFFYKCLYQPIKLDDIRDLMKLTNAFSNFC